ncbi:MAG: alanine racemase [Thermodesulfobacteriota bacterium]
MNDIKTSSIESLIAKYGSPLFVVSADLLKSNVKTFKQMFSDKYPKTEVAYAYKANYLSEVLKIVHNEGAWGEVASDFEFDIARSIGLPGKSIVYNGPGKTKDNLLKAIEEGALINADNRNEIELLSEIAREQNKPIEIGIRINADVGINQVVDRFGFNLESGEAFDIAKQCAESGLLKIVCLHIHLTSYIVEPNSEENFVPAQNIKLIWPKSADMYEIAAKKISNLARDIESRLGVQIKYLDLGGGFPAVDNLTQYVDNIVGPVTSILGKNLPTLILEPGRAIVKNAVFLVTTVLGVKQFPTDQMAVTVDAGINLIPTSFWGMQNLKPINNTEGKLIDTIIYGPLCLQTDIVAKTDLPELKTGEKLVVQDVGAYNIPQSSAFIYPRPQIVMIEDEVDRLIRRNETVADVLNLEKDIRK